MVGLCLTLSRIGSCDDQNASMVASADLIAIAEVASIRDNPKRPDGFRARNELRIKQVLKGAFDASALLVTGTSFRLGQRAIEDSIAFPSEGRRVVIFLSIVTSDEKRFVPVTGIQGLWPLEAGVAGRQDSNCGYRSR
jgi:hypothetical protein